MTVMSVVNARTNGELVAEAAKLWIGPHDVVLDATYGKGNFWTAFGTHTSDAGVQLIGRNHERYGWLITNDLDPTSAAEHHFDFRSLPAEIGPEFDVVVFDPPYIAQGGRKTSTAQDFLTRYGLHDVPTTTLALAQYHMDGIYECARVLRPGGRLLVKTMDYINSGTYQSGYAETVFQAECSGLELVDVFVHHSGTGPQPKFNRDGTPRRQVHSRRCHSYLMIFIKPKGRK